MNRLIRRNSKGDAKIFPSPEFILNFDGASKGNPGLSGAGMVIYKNNEEIWSSCKFIGYKTNNQAEYSALILGMRGALSLGIKTISVLGDSLLVINQVNGIYKVKSESLHDLYKEVQNLRTDFDFIDFNHVYRENNKRADELSNLALENVSDLSQTYESRDLDIKQIHEDCDEEIIIELNPVKSVVIKTPVIKIEKKKQTEITDFLLKGSLFPDI